jgi:diguanylate cyclase (GGDEF)-like protein
MGDNAGSRMMLPMSSNIDPFPQRSDYPADLWYGLSPYLGAAQVTLAAVYLLAGGGGDRWPWILALFVLQVAVNIVLSVWTRRTANVATLLYYFAFFNWGVSSAVVFLAGGYPSFFWLLFALGAVQSGLFIGWFGVLLNAGFAGAALTAPVLWRAGISADSAVRIGLELLLLLVIGLITERATGILVKERIKFKHAEEALRQSHGELAAALELQRRQSLEQALLAEMADFLHACPVLEDTYSIISYYVPRLLPLPDGVLFLAAAAQNDLAATAAWGGLAAERNALRCSPAHCWALRREQIQWMDATAAGMRCHHADSAAVSQYMCIPLIAQREAVGVIHLRGEPGGPGIPSGEAQTRVLSLAKSIGEHVTLAVANLELRETLRNQSIRDGLTGLFNRRYLEETLEREIHRAVRDQAPLSILFLDIDHFKSFNDRFGHEAGDAVLRQLGAFLTAQVRYEDIACRYGGEEFVIVLPDAALSIAAGRAEGIRSGIKSMKVQVGGKTLQGITLSIGVSSIPEFEAVGEVLLRAADAALYQAKSEGRDRMVVAKAGI